MQFETKEQLDNYNYNQKETNIHLIGDRTIICQVVQLISYIKNAVNNGKTMKIDVNVKNTLANPTLLLDVNGFQIPDLIAQDHIDIN